MSYEFITYEHSDRIVTITINRPERLNAVHPPTTDELVDAWERFRNDDDAWIAILTGAGDRAFSAGNDLKYAAQVGSSKVTAASSPQPGGLGGHTRAFTCWKPIIAAVNGYALGGGFEMALACDIIIAADRARFGLPEPTVGFMASSGGAQRLPRSMPLKVAMGYMLTARQMSAEEALRWGLVNEVVPMRNSWRLLIAGQKRSSAALHSPSAPRKKPPYAATTCRSFPLSSTSTTTSI